MTPFPLVIASSLGAADRADTGFGKYPFQPRKSVGDAGKNRIGYDLSRPGGGGYGKRRMLLVRRVAVPFRKSHLSRETGRSVQMNRHTQVLTTFPHWIPARIANVGE